MTRTWEQFEELLDDGTRIFYRDHPEYREKALSDWQEFESSKLTSGIANAFRAVAFGALTARVEQLDSAVFARC